MMKTNSAPLALKLFRRLFPNFFFGNAVLAGCFLILLAETPGQSFFLGLYTERLIEDFGMSRAHASTLFALAFLCSAVSVQVMGTILDRFGPRMMVALAVLPYMGGILLTCTANGPVPLAIGFVVTRVLGPDGIAFAAKVTISRWFRRARGRAMAVASFTVAIEILFCGGFNALSDAIGWREATAVAAAMSMILVLSGLQLLFDSPEALDLLPDGDIPECAVSGDAATSDKGCNEKSLAEEINFTRAEAIRTFPCWVVLAMGFIVCVGWGGLNVHMKNVCAEQGMPLSSVSVIYTVIGVCSPLGSVLLGFLLDYAKTAQGKMRVCVLVPIMSATSLLLAIVMKSLVGGVCFGIATGLFVGMFVVAAGTIFASLFGRRHLGSMQAMFGTFGLCGTGSGPVLLSAFKEAAGSYTTPLVVMAGCALTIGVVMLFCSAPKPPERHGSGFTQSGRGGSEGEGDGGEGSQVDEGQLRLAMHDALAES